MSVALKSFRWGIVGTSGIAGQFAAQLSRSRAATLQAVASRSLERAQQTAKGWGAATAHASYVALLDDPSVDVVYIATPAETHRELCEAALHAGKPVLCEKPLAQTAEDARVIAALAAQRGVFCMEAMWMRFSPLVCEVRERVQSGSLGPVALFTADLGYRTHPSRLQGAQPGRGALLNFGVYGVSLAHFLFGPPRSVSGFVLRDAAGLDTSFSAVLGYDNHPAAICGSVLATLSNEAMVAGPSGRLRLGPPFINPGSLVHVKGAEPSSSGGTGRSGAGLADKLPYASLLEGSTMMTLLKRRGSLTPRPRGSNGLLLEAEEVMRCLAEGRPESQAMPLAESVAVLETIDRIRSSATG